MVSSFGASDGVDPGGPRVTLAEIARQTATSVPTVSKVLNGRRDVSSATRKRVEDALARAGYQRRRPTGGRPLIELVIRGLTSPWALVIIGAVEQIAYEAGYGVVVSAAHDHPRPSRTSVEAFVERQSKGAVLVLSDIATAQSRALGELQIPYVFLDPAGTPSPGVPAVGATNWAGGMSAAEHLLELGHREIAVISGPRDVLCSRARVAGYRDALMGHGVPVTPSSIRFAEFDEAAGLEQATSLLGRRERPSALFCTSDTIAVGAYEAADRLGLRVPDDVSIVGFDNLPLAAWMRPSLTTVSQPLAEMASLATRMLFQLIGSGTLDAPQVEVATRLVTRHSTASPCP